MSIVERAKTVRGVGRFRDSDSFYEGSGGTDAPRGSTTMTLVVIASQRRVLSVDQAQLWSHSVALGQGGWRIEARSANNTIRFLVSDGGANQVSATVSYTQRIDNLFIIAGSFDGSTARIRTSQGQSNSDSVMSAGYTVPIAPLLVGARPGPNDLPASDWAIPACLGADSQALSDAQMATLIDELLDNLRHGRDLDTGLSTFVPEVYYDARDAGATWPDRLGAGVDLARNGSPELFNFRGAV